jgi:glutamyl-tRNA reductase
MVGLSHHAAPLEIRERIALDESAWRAVAPTLRATILLSTCNRVEVYTWVDGRRVDAVRAIERALARAAGVSAVELTPWLSVRVGREAVLHLVRVASGLDSLVVGEEQIRGQVRQALRAAEAHGPLPPQLRGLFERAGESARRIRGGTRLGQAPSIASAGVGVALRHLVPTDRPCRVVVLGAGVMARAAIETLLAHPVHVDVLNRTPAHAAQMVAPFGPRVTSGDLARLAPALAEADLVIGATSARQPLLTRALVARARAAASGRPLVILDIALPRDAEPTVRDLPSVTLIDLDDLERLCPVDSDTRHAEHAHAEALAAAEADRLGLWLRSRAAGPEIAALRSYAEAIREAELRRSAARLRGLTPDQAAAVDALTTGIVNKLMHGPTVALREAATRSSARQSRTRIIRVVRPRHGRRRTG